MLFLQRTYLIFLAYCFLVIGHGLSQDATGNCSFDEKTLCSWSNDKHTDHFDWRIWQGSTPDKDTGPTSDHTGNGSYVYIETSHPRKYNEKARLNSPWMRGAQRMTFFYSMYGSTVESLSVYIRINGGEERIWSRHGNHLSSSWTEGCVALNYNGTYQVIIEGVTGVTSASNIAIDDINFRMNLTCVSASQTTPPETFEVNCTFDKSYCGWRNMVTPRNDEITWHRARSGNSSQSGPSGDHTGDGFYIYINASQSAQLNQSAQLLSPLIRGPKCLRFFYQMYGRGIGYLNVSLQLRKQPGSYLMWTKSGEQGDRWIMGSVDIGYTGECQVFFQASVGGNYTGGLGIDDVTLTNGLCEDESEPQINEQGNCNFDADFCFWRNDVMLNFEWTLSRYSTPSWDTGPSTDHTSGSGMYAYIETSSPRKPGDTARLQSPWMRGQQCMTFYYHMYGFTMGCIVIYIRSQATNRLKPVWLRSEDRGDQWIQGQISINETKSYQVIIDGVRGSSYQGDAALDDFSFQRGACQQTDQTTYYVSSYKGKDFRISTQPSTHNLHSEEFRFTLKHPRGNPNETPYFIYSEASSGQSFVSSNMDPSDYENFPLDVVVLNDENVGRNSRKIYLFDRINNGPMISLDDHGDVNCCNGKLNFSFYAYNVTESDHHSVSGCEPGWYKAGKSCYFFSVPSTRQWRYGRTFCHQLNADLAVVNDEITLEALALHGQEMKLEDRDFFVGLSSSTFPWMWADGEEVLTADDIWGPNEPSGDGRCGCFLNAVTWNSDWAGYGWRWNDLLCTAEAGFICEQPLALPLPMALFSLSGINGTVDMSPTGATKAVSNNITFAPGPFGNPNGSFFFSGDENSYVELNKNRQLDTRFSISVFAWVHLYNSSGPIYKHEPSSYGFSLRVYYPAMSVKVRFMQREPPKSSWLSIKGVLEADSWNFIGTTYNYHTGLATIFVNNETVMEKRIKPNMELATNSKVRIGAMKNKKLYFRGRISCVQVYDQALSVDQIFKIKARCNQTTPLTCSENFFPFHGGCFSINTNKSLNWHQAMTQCNREGGTLAKISREGLRYAFSNLLEGMTPKPTSLHLGLRSREDWTWIDGNPLNESLWMPGYPSGYQKTQSCGALPAGSSRIKNVDCGSKLNLLCQKEPVNSLSYKSSTLSSSALSSYHPSLAVDRSYTTCFRSKKESNPWWQVTLQKPLYVYSVDITDKIDCCPRDSGLIKITVSTSQTGLDPTCTGSLQYGLTQEYKMNCSPPARGSYVTVTLIGDSVSLVLCQVVVRSIEFSREANGVLREGWYEVDYNKNKVGTMREHPAFNNPPESQIILQDFDAPVNVAENYVQRLTAYLQVPESGNYTFYLSCDDSGELWKHDVTEADDTIAEGSAAKAPLISVKRWTGHLEWNKYPEQTSQPIFLDKCRLYRMEAFMKELGSGDTISVGMQQPNGEYERPISGPRLFWTYPGIRRLKVTLQDQKLSGFVGLSLRISGSYHFCCEGVHCPDCPLELNITALGQVVSVDSEINLSCVSTPFTATFNTERQPGNFTVKVSYTYVNSSEQILKEKLLGHGRLLAAVVEECYFESGSCSSWTSFGEKDKWKFSSDQTLTQYPGYFAYIDDSFKARLESPLLPWKSFYWTVGLCLRFNYLMPTKSKSSLKVLVKEADRETSEVVWQLVGYHGEEWSAAQVTWSGTKAIQVIFQGEGFLDNEMNIAIDEITVKTEQCPLSPYFAKPGFRCTDKQFSCKNGECVKKNLRCDGDFACEDGSDEDDCACPVSKFTCQGRCIPSTDMCDGSRHCSNGDDEKNCEHPCQSRHQCLDGSCIAWSNTCSKTLFCKDGTNTPSVCGSGKCHLNDLACTSTDHARCRSFRGRCTFQDGHCGLKSDRNASFDWTVFSGETPTENTGPSFDHTSYNKDGSYIFIETSQRDPGDKARLLSDELEPNETVCVQFWYHMHGSDIGSLSIYVKTNQSETLVWRLSGDQGNRWRFGETALNSPRLFKFVIEGTVYNGSKGDIAVDDLTVMDGNCEEILKQESPDCDFEGSMCDWNARGGWLLESRTEGFETSGRFAASLPVGGSEVPSTLSSPVINTHSYEWKCLRFWYFIGSRHGYDWHTTSLMVFIRQLRSDQTMFLFFADELTNEAQYAQIPLPSNYTNAQVNFLGLNELSGGQVLAIDDVSFIKQPCKQIPWKQDKERLECQQALGMANGAIFDRQISSSSHLDADHTATGSRLNNNRSWSAGSNDVNQWLQIDLGSQFTKVTRVSTQGRSDAAQWVTKYRLQYSEDGENLKYYREPGETIDKEFDGNTNQDTIVYHELNPPIRARYIRFEPEAWQNHISMRVELYGCRKDCQEALGMENGHILDGQISASSEWDSDHAAVQGRLFFQATVAKEGGWTSRYNSPQEWLQIDLGSQYTKVTRVATQGRNAHSQWVTKYRLQYSEDGENFQYYKEQEQIEDKDFTGNADQDTVVYHYLNPPVISRFIRFRPEAWHDHISMRVELYGCHEVECQEALGMRDGAITDAQISASSEWDSDHAATQGRLNFKAFGFPKRSGSWSARKNDRNQWLRIDLLRKDTKVTRVATQGRADQNQWVTKYVLVYNAGKSQYYQEQGRVKIFAGNSDRNTVVYHDLNPPITARYIRFLPMEWFKHISMRVELYGCLQGSGGGCQQALGMQSGAIFNYQITASSQWDSNHAPYQARLHFHPITKMGSWSAGKNNLLQWLQIDLGSQYTKLTRVATQGRNAHSQWVTKYRLQYSEDGDDFQYYKEQGQTDNKDFTGNTDQDTINFHELNPPITARYIRFVPVAWYGHISMRVELYGCQVCLGALGMENGSIPDSQITASSQLNTSHAAAHGRLNLNATEDKAGSWSAGMNYTDQWLQIDLGSQFTKVTRVATQGRSDAAQWVTKYRLQYSEDGENFKYYREQGQTAEKNFTGNTDQDTVVYHELNPPIRARYIRFQPVAWHNHTSMRVELYGCRDERPCDISVDWCGWENVYGWKRIKYEKLDQSNQDDGGDSRVDNENVKGDHDEDDEVDPGNYEIHLPDSSLGYVSFSDMPPNNEGFTNCFWIKTKYSGFFIEYKVAASKEQNATLVMGIYCGDHKFDVIFGDKRSVIPLGVTDNTWHHVCVLWEGHSGLLAVFKDGERNHRSNGFRAGSLNVRMEGIGAMTVGFRTTNISASVVLGKLSGFNVWSYALSPEEILRMSYGCGEEAGDAKAWETVKEGLQKDVEVQWHRTCKDRKGGYLVVDTNLTHFNQPAVLVSPSYIRSHDGHNKCLKFRYMLKGPGKKTLTIYHKSDSYREIPIWISQRNTGRNWFYGQVPLSSVSAFQVSTKGETENNNDSIALAGMYIDGERNCKHKPASAKRACNENLFNMSGYFFSPSFPGYYPNDMFCTWHITVPSSYTIHLELQEFQLGDHPTCEDCFLQIFDGRDEAAPVIGKFCGYGYPPFFTSSSSHFTIVLRCYGNYPKARLKAFYRAVGALNDTESHCLRHQGCPSSCECKEVGAKIMITGGDLLTIPGNLPSNTGAVFFQRNRISQLHEKDFADLTNLEYIDLGSNILLHLDEDCFQNVSSVNTLRLNSNFLRTLPAGAFLGLPGLRVLDLGKNLLYRADVGLLVGLSHLEVLSLRSNQIKELEYGVFRSNSNMTHLYLQNNKLATLPDSLFGALSQLKVLNLSSNELKKVTKDTFHGLASLEYLYLDNNKLSKVPSDAFSELTRLKFITLDRFILCCYAKKSIEGVECESPVDEFSSCDDLMKNKTLQICIWILGILASLGNLFVIIWRIIDKEENRVHSFLLTNLAVADLLMGVYLMTIAVMDLKWRGEYFKHDIAWRSGIGCKIAGVLSMLSSEVSVLILTIITLDRFISIVFPFKFNRLTFKSAAFSCVGVWIFGVVISVIPIVGMDYFFDESGNFGFYGRSAVCLPLQLSEGTPSAGWEYSVTFFVVMNFISFTFILIAYITMFWTVKRVTRAVRSTNLNKESAMAKRLVFIVMTDFCCWMPIIIINILSLTGNFHDPDKIAYVWIAVFVLPLNSSLNPILYTFSTERTKRSLLRKRKNVTGLVMKTVNSRGAGYSRADDRLKTHDDNTLVSNVFSSPLPSPKVVGTHRRESEQVHTKLKLIEEVQILQDDIEGKRSTGYVTAWCEEGATLSMVLLKYFGKELKEDWNREADIVQGLRCSVDPHDNLLHHRWHSKACDQSIEHGKQKIRSLCSNSFLICYDFVSSSTLEDFLCDKGTVLNFDGVCAIACDVISAIERLEDHGILHNNITTNNILIGQCSRLPPITAVLGGFSRASKMNEAGAFTNLGADEQSYYGNDIEQFGHLLAVLLGNCHGSSEYVKLHEIMNLCFEEKVEKRRGASYIRELLEEAWSAEGVWDTYL